MNIESLSSNSGTSSGDAGSLAPLPEYEVSPHGEIPDESYAIPTDSHPYENLDHCPENAKMSLISNQCECLDGYTIDPTGSACIIQCPPNSSPSSPGKCQCDPGYSLDSHQAACVLPSAGGFGLGVAST